MIVETIEQEKTSDSDVIQYTYTPRIKFSLALYREPWPMVTIVIFPLFLINFLLIGVGWLSESNED